MSTVRANTYLDASGGSNAQLFGVASPPNSMGFRNRIINGDMRIDQRNAGASQSINNTTAYTVDRWYVNFTGGTGTSQRVSGSGAFTNALRLTGGASVSSGFFGQKIESFNSADLAGQTVTVSIRASSSVLTSLSWFSRFPNTQDNYAAVTSISNGTITINSTPTNYTFQFTCPSGVTNGLEVYFTFGAFTSGTLDITGVQLEAGTVASAFERRDYGRELMMCQRYFEKSYNQSNAPGTATSNGISQTIASTNFLLANGTVYMKVAKRANPTVLVYGINTAGASGVASEYNVGGVFVADRTCNSAATGESSFWLQIAGTATAGNDIRFQWTATAEL